MITFRARTPPSFGAYAVEARNCDLPGLAAQSMITDGDKEPAAGVPSGLTAVAGRNLIIR